MRNRFPMWSRSTSIDNAESLRKSPEPAHNAYETRNRFTGIFFSNRFENEKPRILGSQVQITRGRFAAQDPFKKRNRPTRRRKHRICSQCGMGAQANTARDCYKTIGPPGADAAGSGGKCRQRRIGSRRVIGPQGVDNTVSG